jgi:hypothetical protein
MNAIAHAIGVSPLGWAWACLQLACLFGFLGLCAVVRDAFRVWHQRNFLRIPKRGHAFSALKDFK